jgi:hypothetical protein
MYDPAARHRTASARRASVRRARPRVPHVIVRTRSMTVLKSLVVDSGFLSWMAEPMFEPERRAGLIAPPFNRRGRWKTKTSGVSPSAGAPGRAGPEAARRVEAADVGGKPQTLIAGSAITGTRAPSFYGGSCARSPKRRCQAAGLGFARSFRSQVFSGLSATWSPFGRSSAIPPSSAARTFQNFFFSNLDLPSRG